MEKLLAIASLGQKAYGRWLFRRLLSGVMMVVMLVIIVSIMTSALLVGCLYAAYLAFLYYGLAPAMALLFTGILAVLVVVALAVIIAVTLAVAVTVAAVGVVIAGYH